MTFTQFFLLMIFPFLITITNTVCAFIAIITGLGDNNGNYMFLMWPICALILTALLLLCDSLIVGDHIGKFEDEYASLSIVIRSKLWLRISLMRYCVWFFMMATVIVWIIVNYDIWWLPVAISLEVCIGFCISHITMKNMRKTVLEMTIPPLILADNMSQIA